MNFSSIPSSSWLGRALRAPLRLLPEAAVVPILQGRLRGYRWIVGSSTHGCWLGTYEYDKQRVFQAVVRPGDVVLDVGAHAGFYALLASALVGPTGRVFAFEPSPRNLGFLREHVRLNAVTNVEIIAAAVSDLAGHVRFADGPHSSMGRISEDGEQTVPSVELDDFLLAGGRPAPQVVKMDIEGGEYAAMLGGERLLRTHRPTLLIATHGPEVHDRCCRLLRGLGYQLRALDGGDVATTDDLIAVHPERGR